jgi:integrase
VTLKAVANHFLAAKQALVDNGELTRRTWSDYREACGEALDSAGKTTPASAVTPDDFARLRQRMAAKWGPHRLKKAIFCVRCLFKHALSAGLIERPANFGPGFAVPSKRAMRLHRASQGKRLFAAEEVRQLIDAAPTQLRAMVLLGINCGFGNADCGHLPLSAVNLDTGWIDYPRPKTGIARRCPLWPETVAALREALAGRPAPKDDADADLVFLTRFGAGWHTDTSENRVAKVTYTLLRQLGIARDGLSFYALRHTFRTVADGARDPVAADHVMGHETPGMSSIYREGIDDSRLRAVADHVRDWLWPTP